jgi:class 3 adenylate cyclase
MPKPPITFSKKITVHVPAEKLWSFLADTDRLDRAVGIPPISFTPDPNKKGHNLAVTKFKGFRLEYEEFPYEWVEPQYYKILRRFTKGPIEEILTGIRLTPKNNGTEFETFTEIIPRTAVGRFLANTAIKTMATRHLVNLVKAFEKFSQDSQHIPPILPKIESINSSQLETRLDRLRGYDANPSLIQKLKKHLLQGSDLEVVSMRPFEVADRWGEERMEVLFFFLFATKAEVLDLHWTVLCPNCSGTSEEPISLSKLKAQAHCKTCEITYGTDLAASVEARFSVNAAIRRARYETYCIAGPANLPQILAQLRLEPNKFRKEMLNLRPGIIRVRSFQTEGFHQIQVQPTHSTTTTLNVQCESNQLHINTKHLLAGTVSLEVKNNTGKEILLIVERETWRENAVTAALVTSLQNFKDLFPQEAVAPGEEIGIASLTIMFTDLRSSTPLYKKIGDTKAFSFVQNHFRFLTESVSNNRGGILKTMGDAIMAQFATSLDALKASLEIQRQWENFCKTYGMYSDVNVKIGVHQGSAIAINNRGAFDCFGATINLAARLQKFSDGGDVIISDIVLNDPDVALFLSMNDNHKITSFKARIKGFDTEEFLLHRIANG